MGHLFRIHPGHSTWVKNILVTASRRECKTVQMGTLLLSAVGAGRVGESDNVQTSKSAFCMLV